MQVAGRVMLMFGLLAIVGVQLGSQSGAQAVLASSESSWGAPGWRRALPGALLLVVAVVSVFAVLSESRAAIGIVCSLSQELLLHFSLRILRLSFSFGFCNRLIWELHYAIVVANRTYSVCVCSILCSLEQFLLWHWSSQSSTSFQPAGYITLLVCQFLILNFTRRSCLPLASLSSRESHLPSARRARCHWALRSFAHSLHIN